MPKGKNIPYTWFCTVCNMGGHTKQYNKKSNDKITKETPMFCSNCRTHKTHKRKETK